VEDDAPRFATGYGAASCGADALANGTKRTRTASDRDAAVILHRAQPPDHEE
jgi:hypothetical protein